jgi:ceramide glucosyltransferase
MLRGHDYRRKKDCEVGGEGSVPTVTYLGFVTGVLALIVIAGGIYNLFAIFCVAEFFTTKRRKPDRISYPPVSILKPVKGLDPGFRKNIDSFCRLDYPEYEILIGFIGADDEALEAARAIADAYPGKVRVVTTREKIGVNEKVSNLKGLIDSARYGLVAISDSDMMVDERYLKTIVEEYLSEDNVGLVTSPYKISGPVTAGAALESLTIAVDFLPSVLVARKLEGITFGLGASMLLTKDTMKNIGGMEAIADYLADDYQIGNRIWQQEHKVLLSGYVMEDVVGKMGIKQFLLHQVRWGRTYRASRPKGFFGYGVTHVLFFSCLLIAVQGVTAYAVSVLAVVLVLRLFLAFLVYGKVIRRKQWLKWLPLLPFRDLLAFSIWAWSFAGRGVFWRGAHYLVEQGGKIKPAPGRR